MKRTLAVIFSITLMAFFMAGCSGMRLVENDVSAFYNWNGAPPGPSTPYRFERLPSQQLVGAQQAQVEGLAQSALAKVGMVLNPATARLSVQVRVSTQLIERGLYDGAGFGGFGFAHPGIFLSGGSRGASLGLSFPMRFSEPSYYRHELALLVRDLGSGQVVFETRALSDSVHNDTLVTLGAMFEAALRGFPQPPPGRRRINVEIAPPQLPPK